jgi:hypothetical protein
VWGQTVAAAVSGRVDLEGMMNVPCECVGERERGDRERGRGRGGTFMLCHPNCPALRHFILSTCTFYKDILPTDLEYGVLDLKDYLYCTSTTTCNLPYSSSIRVYLIGDFGDD